MEQRRNLIRWLLGGGVTASLISFLYPAIKFMDPPEVSEASVNEVPAGKVSDLKPVLNGLGIWVVSTSKGVLSDREARQSNIGGEVLCEIY